MYNPKSKTPSKGQKPSIDIKSHTPSKVMIKPRNTSRPLNTSFSSSRSSTIRESSAEPLRMSIKLEDIIKSGTQQSKAVNLKPELIEPEIESSIPCFEYAPKSTHHLNGKNSKMNDMYPDVSRPHQPFEDFCLDKMDDDCKNFERSLMNENKNVEDAEKFLMNVFNQRVKLKIQGKPRDLPSVVLVKTSKGYEYYNVIKY